MFSRLITVITASMLFWSNVALTETNKNYKDEIILDGGGGMVKFETGQYYAPSFHTNYTYPYFVWDGFEKINPEFWGTGTEPGVSHDEIQTEKYKLTLSERQMLYSYYRLPPGQLEFRWFNFGCLNENGAIDQLIGFGDPGESFWAGFRLEKGEDGRPRYRLAMQVKNFDETFEEVIYFDECPNEKKRYKVRRYADKIIFMINNQIKLVVDDTPMKYGLPDIGLEILISNRQGTALNASLAKYDAYW